MNPYQSRFSDALWYNSIQKLNEDTSIVIGGVGGIGSWASVAIARLGFENLILIDNDLVDEVNLAGQFYFKSDISLSKVMVIKNKLSQLIPTCNITIFQQKIEEVFPYINKFSKNKKIYVSCFDNMNARKEMFEYFINDENAILFIDGRLTAELFQVFFIPKTDNLSIIEYENIHLFPDSDIEDAPCSFKQTTHLAMGIGGMIGGLLSNFIVNYSNEKDLYSVPFFTEYMLPLNLLR